MGLALRVGVGPSFSGLGLAVTSFGQGLASGVGPSRGGGWPFLLFGGGSPFLLGVGPFLLAVEVGSSGWGWNFGRFLVTNSKVNFNF